MTQEEIDVIEKNATWKITKVSEGKKLISTKWFLKTKCDAQGQINKHKVRLVVHGFEQREGVDFYETFAPMVHWSIIHTTIAFVL